MIGPVVTEECREKQRGRFSCTTGDGQHVFWIDTQDHLVYRVEQFQKLGIDGVDELHLVVEYFDYGADITLKVPEPGDDLLEMARDWPVPAFQTRSEERAPLTWGPVPFVR